MSIKYRKSIDVESRDDIHVLHFDEKDEEAAPQIMEIETEGRKNKVKEVSFETESFSIYAVVGSTDHPENESRMTLNFYNLYSDPVNPIATVYVKNSDDTDEELLRIIYDPGAGNVSSTQVFKGWILDEPDYGVEDDDNGNRMSIEDIRAWAKEKTVANSITENETHNFYAMIFNTFLVTYKDKDGVVIYSHALISTDSTVQYKIDQHYEVHESEEQFRGWYAQPQENVSPSHNNEPYENLTVVTLSGDVDFTVYAPKGHWLSFEGNGSGAHYTPPQFLTYTAVTVPPTAPTRNGYEFQGWYTGPPSAEGEWPTGTQFTFGGTISQNTTLYAAWTKKSTANFSVIIWKQRSTDDKNAADADKTYDVADVIPLSGSTLEGQNNASAVISQDGTYVYTGRGQNEQVRNFQVLQNGRKQEKGWPGFHAGRYDQNVKISPEGTTVLNVYYDRNLITINFDAGGGVSWTYPFIYDRYFYDSVSKTYKNTMTYTGLYDSELPFDWPIRYWTNAYGTGTAQSFVWQDPQGVKYTFLGAFKLDPIASVSISFTYATGGAVPHRFIKMKPDGNWPDANEEEYILTVDISEGDFKITEKYAGFHVAQYKTGNDYDSNSTGWNTATPGQEVNTSNVTALNIRFKRDYYDITYLDGTYFDGNGAILKEATKSPLGKVQNIYYGEDISSYNEGGSNYYNPESEPEHVQEQYVFAGWYIDPTCTREYHFDTMPEGGVTAYAKWVQKQYRVFLHPNVATDDTSFSLGNQPTSFLTSYYEQISNGSTITTVRENYELVGWYTDVARTKGYYFDTRVTDDVATTDYNRTDDTELDKYGNTKPGYHGYNDDAYYKRVWVRHRLDLYARWRATLDGAKGIKIEYDPGDGSNEPKDDMLYLDSSRAAAGAASTPNNSNEQFLYWVVQSYDYGSKKYIDKYETDPENPPKLVTASPGVEFDVLKSDSMALVTQWVDPYNEDDVYTVPESELEPGLTPPDNKYTKIKTASYTVRLRAQYGPKQPPTPTHIIWYANNGTGDTEENTDLQINEAVDIMQPGGKFSYDRYEFLGWARQVETLDSEGHVTSIGGAAPANLKLDLNKNNLFLAWDGETFRATPNTGGGFEEGDVVSKIAADEKMDYHGMVAVWKEIPGYYVYHSSTKTSEFFEMPEEGTTVNLTEQVYFYDENNNIKYLYGGYYEFDEETGERGNAYQDNPGTAMVPEPGKTYYLKEVDPNYLKPQLYIIYSEATRVVSSLYGFVNFDIWEDYDGCGMIVQDVTDEGNLIQEEYSITDVTDEVKITKPNTAPYFLEKTIFGAMFGDGEGKLSECVFGFYQIGQSFITPGGTLEVTGFYTTLDGVRVTGSKHRKIQFGGNEGDPYVKFTGWTSNDGNTKTGIVNTVSTVENRRGEGNPDDDGSKRIRYSRVLEINVPEDKITYTVTKMYGTEELEPQTVEPGARSGEIIYPEKDGYLFTGWFQDEALSTPADFSNVQSDMTVYAGYIPVKDVTLSLARKSGKTGDVTFTATVSVKNTNKFREVGVSCSHNGEPSEEALTKKTYVNVGSTKNPKYTYKFSGPVVVMGLEATDSFTASVYWVTKDGTRVTGAARACTYKGGSVKVQN